MKKFIRGVIIGAAVVTPSFLFMLALAGNAHLKTLEKIEYQWDDEE
jgi:hypothetical protein